ncbi:MAG TPA: hypothetical protein DET40_18930 [Lentisphaeria bacterium]|nr:MAG: hypothetical protein A2X45_25435 [Lentisphaerae bacterium GWF2_50_93]HCE45621.1 hypothetical protein [Lentisphaeria bacterium]
MNSLKSTSQKKLLAGLIISLLCFAAFTYVNYWIFKHKTEGFLNKYGNYPDFYILDETPAIVGFKKRGVGQLQCIISPKTADSWTIKMPDGTVSKSQDPNPVITLKNGKNRYELTPGSKDGLPLILNISYVGSETYKKRGNSSADNYYITESNYPIIAHKSYGTYDFAYREELYKKEEVAEAKKMIYGEMGVLENDGSRERILKISKYLYDMIEQYAGIPSDSMKYLSPLDQYKRIISGKDGAWCHNSAVIYAFFMTSAGIPTRLVSLEGEIDQVKIAGHIFAESFIKEKNKWAYSDLDNGFFLVEDANGIPFTTMELINLKATDSIGKAFFICYEKKEIRKRTFDSRTFNQFEDIRNKPNMEIIYQLPRANRYSLPSMLSRYTVNPDIAYSPDGSNFKYYVKLSFLALGLISLVSVLLCGLMLIKFRKLNLESRKLVLEN